VGVFILFFKLFFAADLVGKFVLGILAIASFYIWGIIFSKIFDLIKIYRLIDSLKTYSEKMTKIKPLVLDDVFIHGEIYDQILFLHYKPFEYEKKKDLIKRAIDSINERWALILEKDLNYLSIIGSIAPFIGLFGTVWGIMNSFQAIASSNSTNIAIVAPGISEALFATALGLFVAIPASIASNIFYSKIENLQRDAYVFAAFFQDRLEGLK
jgi:biopolymer transport protein TolQ